MENLTLEPINALETLLKHPSILDMIYIIYMTYTTCEMIKYADIIIDNLKVKVLMVL